MASRSSRNQPLDILRGIAILLVLGFHYHHYVEFWGRIGWSGVDLFFVLSGFLISGLLFNEYKRFGRIDMKRFLIRRGFKIYPAFYFLMAYTAIDELLTRGRVPEKILGDLFFVQNYFPHIWAHGWSLAVEEHFYWLLPLLLLLMIAKSRDKRNPFSAMPWVFLLVGLGCLGLRTLEFLRGVPSGAIQSETHLRIDTLFFGVLLGYYRHFRPDFFHSLARKPLWLPGLLLLVTAYQFPAGTALMDTIGLTCLYLGFGCIVVWAVDRPPSRRAPARLLAWTGRYSYSIYLWQLPLGFLFFTGPPTPLVFLIYIVSAIALGAALSWLVEVPTLKLRDRWYPPRARAADPAPPAAVSDLAPEQVTAG